MVPRIVLDTNVFVGSLLSEGGRNRDVLRACLSGQAQSLMGVALFSEYEDLLGRAELFKRCPLSSSERQVLFEAFLSVSSWVKIYYLWRPNLPDEADNHLVELALAGNAHAIVTNNIRDFQRGELDFTSLRILTPNDFLKTLS